MEGNTLVYMVSTCKLLNSMHMKLVGLGVVQVQIYYSETAETLLSATNINAPKNISIFAIRRRGILIQKHSSAKCLCAVYDGMLWYRIDERTRQNNNRVSG